MATDSGNGCLEFVSAVVYASCVGNRNGDFGR